MGGGVGLTDKTFFNVPTEQSQVKARIVSKYFHAWSNIIKARKKRLGYVDLYSGPGRYDDGTPSTLLLILRQACRDEVLRSKLVTVFNDIDSRNIEELTTAVGAVPGIDWFVHQPRFLSMEVGRDIVPALFRALGREVPSLFFVDPWGYKGLSLDLLLTLTSGWGCDCIFFLNYVRVNAGLANPVLSIEHHMDDLFGRQRARNLRRLLVGRTPEEREETIVTEMKKALAEDGTRHVADFSFKKGARTSHYLLLVTKHPLGEGIMKEILAKESSATIQGVASYEFDPSGAIQGDLFERPFDSLQEMLINEFAGQEGTVEEVYQRHHSGRPYTRKNYRDALLALEAAKRIVAEPPANLRPHRGDQPTLGETVKIKFPAEGS